MIKITQVRDGGNHVTQSTLTLDAWVERMKEEVKTCPVTMFISTQNSDGAGGYYAVWTVENYLVKSLFVLHDF